MNIRNPLRFLLFLAFLGLIVVPGIDAFFNVFYGVDLELIQD